MEISIKGFDKLAKSFGNSARVIEESNREMLNVATMMVWGKAKDLAPVDTHMLKNTMLRTYNSERGVVGSNLPYAKYQEFGTKDHGPRTAKMLAWPVKGKGGWFAYAYAKRVRGVKARHFLKGGLDELKQNIEQVKTIAAKLVIQKLSF